MSHTYWTPSRVYGGTYWVNGRFGIIVDRLRGARGQCTLVVQPLARGDRLRCISCANIDEAKRTAGLAPRELAQLGMAA